MREVRVVGVLGALVLVGCAESNELCTSPADCPAGYTCRDGRCSPRIPDVGAPDAAPDSAEPDRGPFVWPDSSTDAIGCPANHNGAIERPELLLTLGSAVTYELGTEVPVDLAGSRVGGTTVWDLTAAAANDHPQALKLDPVPAWAAPSFTPPPANITYAMLMDVELDGYGVFSVSDTQMLLLGMISGVQDKGLLSYSTPIEMLRFPVQAGESYTSSSLATGHWVLSFCPTCWLCSDCPLSNWDSYEVEVVGTGELKLPALTLDVVLVRTVVTQNWWSTTTVFMFIAECYGTVARVVVDGEVGDDVKSVVAAQRWRLAMP